MEFREASNCFWIFEIIVFAIALSSMTFFCSGFEHLESEWIFRMYPAGRHLSRLKVSFDTSVRSHLLAPLFYGADNAFMRKA